MHGQRVRVSDVPRDAFQPELVGEAIQTTKASRMRVRVKLNAVDVSRQLLRERPPVGVLRQGAGNVSAHHLVKERAVTA